jgi:hypothetical protein
VPQLNTAFKVTLQRGADARARSELEALPELSIFLTRNHVELLRVAGQSRNALQYEIGPIDRLEHDALSVGAVLYAPLRVVLSERLDGRTVFEYDLPSSLFGQFGDDRVTEVGRKLDGQLEMVLLQAAS